MGWESQGRQEHGWFGHGAGPGQMKALAGPFGPGQLPDRIASVAYGVIGALPRRLRARASAQYDAGNLKCLTEAMAIWSRGLHLDEDEFAARFFGRASDDPVAVSLHAAVLETALASDHADLRAAAEKVADAIKRVGIDRWPGFLTEAAERTRDRTNFAAGQKKGPFSDHAPEEGAIGRLREQSSGTSGLLLASTIFSTPHYIGRIGAENIPDVEGSRKRRILQISRQWISTKDRRVKQQEHDVASSADLAEGAMRAAEAAGETVLLTRIGGVVHAVGGTCPHAGGPLAEGALCGERVVCPWHKAAFSVVTGARLDPPAVDALPRYAVREADGRILVGTPAEPPEAGTETASDARVFVIVGAGAAGSSAAQELRERRFGGRIVMLDRENRVPYDRTLLSKYHLSGEKGGEKTPLQRQSWWAEHDIERATAEVVSIEPADRLFTCADGSLWRYDAALVATGGAPRRPDLPGIDLPGVFTLRSRADADAILAAAERGRRAVVSGSGFIGMEVAASLRERGLDVTVVSDEAEPFANKLGPAIGAVFRRLHESKGVRFRLGSRIASFDGAGALASVGIEGGERIEADLAVVGAGIAPLTGLLGLDVSRDDTGAVIVDATLRAADRLYAAGDIAAFPLMGDGPPVRVEHWRVAQQQGRIAARNMLGGTERYDAVPVFWTIQYMKRLDYVGHAATWDGLEIDGSLDEPKFLAFYLQAGRVAAAAGFGRDRDMAAIVELMESKRDWTAAALLAAAARR